MQNKLKNILNLSKLFIKENNTNLKLLNNNKLNKKSFIFWVYVVLFFAIFYLSSECVKYMVGIGKTQIFLNVFLLFLEFLIVIRTIMVSLNVFYFSKDIENILHLPLKPIEILLAKFNTILYMNYEIELMFGVIPLVVYGIYIQVKISFFINLFLALLIFPIFPILVVSILMIFLMKTIKIFKNKDTMQIIISFTVIFIVMFLLNKAIDYVFSNTQYIIDNQEFILNNINEKIVKINSYFLNITPTVKMLQEVNTFKILFEYLKLIFINLIGFLAFFFLGNKLYLKQLLKANFYFKKEKRGLVESNKQKNISKKIKNSRVGISYIKKEFKLLLKNPLFFIQSIYPVLLMTVMASILIIALVPAFNEVLHKEENIELLNGLKFDIEAVCIILGGIQIVGLCNYSSVTAFSREGKNAYIIKTLPISLYKQFIYKNIPQILLNTISEIVILTVIYFQIPAINIEYIFIMFVLSILLNIINSIVLTLIDLKMPKLEWDAEYEILKNNKNKLLQYVLIIINVLFLMYIKNLLNNHNLNISLLVFGLILIGIILIMNLVISKKINKLFKKIN